MKKVKTMATTKDKESKASAKGDEKQPAMALVGGDTGSNGTTDVVVTGEGQTTALALAGDGFAAYAGGGMENVGKDDMAIPFWVVLQSGSPQCKRSDGAYVEGAVEGMLFNTVTKQVVDPLKTEVVVVPCAYDRNFVEWKLRENGGGFVKQYDAKTGLGLLEQTMRDEKGRDILQSSGNQLNDTRSFYVMVLDPETGYPAPGFIAMTSTQIKKSKQWLTQQNLLKLKGPNGVYTPPMYATKWRITTVPEQNEKGSWMGWAFEFVGYLSGPNDPVFVMAREFNTQVASGTVKADLSKTIDVAGADGFDGPSNGTVTEEEAAKF